MFLVKTVEPAPMKVILVMAVSSLNCDVEGRADEAAGVFGLGFTSTSATGPSSTIRPFCMTMGGAR